MKKLFLSVIFLFVLCFNPLDTQAGYNVPTAEWGLYQPDGITHEQALAMHLGHYSFSAYINHYKLYSNYYFHVETSGRFVINCSEMYSVSDSYRINMYNKNNPILYVYNTIGSNTHSFHKDYSYYATTLGYDAYFCIDGTYGSGAHVSITGYMDTY